MGSPVSVIVANLVMENVENRALSTYHSPPPFWKRYVDDICTAMEEYSIEEFQDHLNSIEPSIKFTMNWNLTEKWHFWTLKLPIMKMAV